ncbi:MAG: hypothetical protein K2X11_00155 [Acetobacteraceae bacterium]|nr:hypothetical protein [Acetobacteraceae bacterium]
MTNPARRALLAATPVLALLAACETPPPPRPADPRLILTPPVMGLGVGLPRVAPGPDGRLRLNLDIANPAGADFPLRYQVDWLDETGRPLSTIQSRPIFRSLARGTITTIEADAPSTRARDFRMTLDVDG